MSLLGNRNNLIDDLDEKESFKIPSIITNKDNEMTLKKTLVLSSILHPTIVGLAWLLVFVLALLGISFSIFEKPKPKMNDIEFVLVDNLKEQKPLHKTNLRSDKNTRTGGKRDPKKKVSMPSPTPSKKVVQQKSTPGPKAKQPTEHKKVVKQKTTPKNIFKSLTQPKSTQEPAPKAVQEARPQPPSTRPALKPSAVPRPTMKPSSSFSVPVPKGGAAPTKSYSTGPVGGRGVASSGGSTSSGRSGGSSRGSYAPVPSLAPTSGGGGASGSKLSRGSSGSGVSGNPGGGGGAPGVDSMREPDFGPYMRELQRRIKMNWDPPRGNESKRVVLLFKIARDGRLLSAKVFKSSGVPSADKAALNAVELTAPFKPLPAGFKGSNIDIQFTFDYNVFGASGYR